MKKLLLSSAIGIALATSISAQAFQTEFGVGGGYGEATLDGDDVDVGNYQIGATFYAAPVRTGNGPLAEAAFLDKATSISVAYISADVDDDDADGDAISGAWHWVTSESNIIVDLGYSRIELDDDGGDLDAEALVFGIGSYLTDTSTLSLSYSQFEVDDEDAADTLGLNYQGLYGPDNHLRLNASILRTDLDEDFGDDDGVGFAVGATYYPNRNLGLGLSYAMDAIVADGLLAAGIAMDDVDADLLGLKVDWFAKDELRITFNYFDGELDDIEVEMFNANMNFRF